MKHFLAVVPLLFLASCGIETIEYLPQPPVQSYLNQTDPTRLTFTHNPSVYSSTPDFQGYEVYYRLYGTVSGPFDNLANDIGLLAATPTRDYLITLGYQRMNAADDRSTPFPLISGLSGSETITLDFFNFLTVMTTNPSTNHLQPPIAPIPQVEIGSSPSFGVYRSVVSNGSSVYPWFSDLYLPFTIATSDMNIRNTAALGLDNTITTATQNYEIDVFIVAYAFTPEATIYSQPAPWGVISPLKVF